ncbi:MAG: gluconate 2-dehydrogenase subunit 3 family protein [Halieaceae bacterium]|jgi:gluconate 2-dehydrogenase gamma chain|nr:gluconate 2-dehydrogenase subunit 3 family protein [Halieaceae bacterium]
MNRRQFLECSSIFFCGLTASQLGVSLTAEQRVHLTTADNYLNRDVSFFDSQQRSDIVAIADAIIPRTETPGAVDARVPRYVELMVSNWLTDPERKLFMAGLDQLQQRSRQRGDSFSELGITEQLALLEQLESEAGDHSWYDFGNIRREYLSDAPFICQIKELTVWGFFSSEVGATQVLRYKHMPMYFDGDVPLDSQESAWYSGAIE